MTTEAATAATGIAASAATGIRRRLVLGVLVSAQFVVMLDTSIVNVALPTIQTDLGLSATGATWVINAYVLAFGGLLLASGRLADLLGRRRMFIAGSMLFTAGSLLAAAAGNEQILIAGRVVQGVGAAMLSPAAMSLLLLMFPGAQRAKAMSAWGAASALGGATGVVAGGVLAESFGWPSVFLVTVPISAAAAIMTRGALLDTPRAPRRRFDLLGSAAITGAVVGLVNGALAVPTHGWGSAATLGGFAVAAVLSVSFVLIERRATDPLVPLGLLRSRALSTGIWLALLGGAARASTFVLIALFLQQALAMTPMQAGLAMVPTSLSGFVVSLALLPRLLKAIGAERTLAAGLVTLASGHLWLAHASYSAGYLGGVLPGLLLVAIGVALSFTPTTMVIAAATPDSHAGLASGLAASTTQVGAALGIAVFTVIGLSADPSRPAVLGTTGFSMAFTAAAAVALTAAVLGATIRRSRS